MTAALSPPSLRHSPQTRPGLLVVLALILVGGSVGSLGGPTAAVAFAATGGLWGVVLTLAAAWLTRSEPRRRAWATGVLSVAVVVAGLLSGSGLMGQLLFNTALSDAPEVFATLVRGSLGDAEALPFYLFNTPLEWLLVPAALLLTWQVPRQRHLVLPAIVIFVFTRMWTYLYYVPRIFDWSQGTAPLTPDQLDAARLWVDLSWVRLAIDIATMVLLLLAALAPATNPAPAPPHGRTPADHETVAARRNRTRDRGHS